jgi:hypothetical protein
MKKELDAPMRDRERPYPGLGVISLALGLVCMAIAGVILIQGLLQFSANQAAQWIFIASGIAFQVVESFCFVAASRTSPHSRGWRYAMFTLGVCLFVFSIAIMTIAQRAALAVDELAASANDEQRRILHTRLASIDQLIDGYRLNAATQSRSVYAQSRKLGQTSLNLAKDLEEQKQAITAQLLALASHNTQTAADFFTRVERVIGWPATHIEFWFLFLRACLIEIAGVVCLSYGAYGLSVSAPRTTTTSAQPITQAGKEKPVTANRPRRVAKKPRAKTPRATQRTRTVKPSDTDNKPGELTVDVEDLGSLYAPEAPDAGQHPDKTIQLVS